MADDSSALATGDPNLPKSEQYNPNLKADLAPTPPPLQQLQPQVAAPEPSSATSLSQPGTGPPHVPLQISGAPVPGLPPPPFRPGLQFNPVANFQNPSVLNPGVQPPGVSSSSVMAVPGSVPQLAPYQVPPGQVPNPAALRPFLPMPNGYAGIPGVAPQGTMPPPGVHRYPSPYPAMIRPGFPLRPPGAIGTLPVVPRPPVPGIPGVRPVAPPVVRPATLPSVTPAEKPQTTIYIGKIATVENDFMLSVLQFCGPVKHWIRAQDPTTGKPKGFGFYEFESAEGILRAIRLLSKLNIDGQELLVNVNQATKEYLQRYVEKKLENAKKVKESQAEASKKSQAEGSEKEQEKAESSEKIESAGVLEESKKDGETKNKENIDIANSAVVTDDEREADREALEKIKNAVEERLKTKPLPPPPPPLPADGSAPELAAKSKDGDSGTDIARSAEHSNDHETSGEHNRPETSSPDQSGKHERRSRDRDRERDIGREKDHEMERFEREAERERARKEREQRRRLEDAERAYQARLRLWERREREKEKERQYEKERERDKERKRKKEIRYDEEEDEDEDDSRRRWHRGATEERRRRRLREKEDDLADRLKEEEEVAEAKKRAEEEKLQQQQIDALRLLSGQAVNGASPVENEDKTTIQTVNESVHGNHSVGDVVLQNGSGSDLTMAVDNASETQQSGGGAPSKKLGFGLLGSGKRTTVPSVFHEEDEDEMQKAKKMRPLVPIDYTAEEQQAVRHSGSGTTPPHLAAAAEFAKRISNANPKEGMSEPEKERSRRLHDKAGHRDKDRVDGDGKEKGDHGFVKAKTPDTKKLWDAKQLIDTIPKTKDELFSFEIDWAIYDQHQLHERMRPWISKKITEFLGEEETTLVDYIVSNTQEHVKASQMLELLQSILDEEAEMFVLKMWRMLIFEIKRVESGIR